MISTLDLVNNIKASETNITLAPWGFESNVYNSTNTEIRARTYFKIEIENFPNDSINWEIVFVFVSFYKI